MRSCDNQRSANTPDVHNNTRAHSTSLAALIAFCFASNLDGKFIYLVEKNPLTRSNEHHRALCPLMQEEGGHPLRPSVDVTRPPSRWIDV